MLIRNETAGDIPAISRLVTEALRMLAQSTGTEASIVEALRAKGARPLARGRGGGRGPAAVGTRHGHAGLADCLRRHPSRLKLTCL